MKIKSCWKGARGLIKKLNEVRTSDLILMSLTFTTGVLREENSVIINTLTVRGAEGKRFRKLALSLKGRTGSTVLNQESCE